MLVSYLGEYDAKTSVSGNGFVQWHSNVLKIDTFVNLQKQSQQECIQSVL
jgi:hypothetical protein